MEIKKKEVVRSAFYFDDIQNIYEYGEASFGIKAALNFYDELKLLVRGLETQYLLHPECRHLVTKTKMYRNIILGSYLIIYRVKATKIEVLRAFHGSRSPKLFKSIKKNEIIT